MHPIIEMLRHWEVVPNGIQLVEETHTFKLIGFSAYHPGDIARDRHQVPLQGEAEVTFKYFVVGDLKLHSTELPKVRVLALGMAGELAWIEAGFHGRVIAFDISEDDAIRWRLYTEVLTEAGHKSKQRGDKLIFNGRELPWPS